MEYITKAQYAAIPGDYKGKYMDFDGKHPEWVGRRTAFLPGHGTTLFIEGVSFEINDAKAQERSKAWGITAPSAR